MVNPLFATILISSNLQSVAIPGQDCGEIKNNNNINNKNTLHQKQNHWKKFSPATSKPIEILIKISLSFWKADVGLESRVMEELGKSTVH